MQKSDKTIEEMKNDFLYGVILKDQHAATEMWTMFNKDRDAIAAAFKPGRKFWMFNEHTYEFDLITITYVRSGVAFYKKEQNGPEEYMGTRSLSAAMLYPRRIYIQEIVNYLKNTGVSYKKEDVIEMYKRMPLDIPRDYMKITIDFTVKDEEVE